MSIRSTVTGHCLMNGIYIMINISITAYMIDKGHSGITKYISH